MPIYEYKCTNEKCKLTTFERWGKKIEDCKKDDECPKCKSKAPRIYSAGQLIIL
jgi:putative FmdB family regulatory protein